MAKKALLMILDRMGQIHNHARPFENIISFETHTYN